MIRMQGHGLRCCHLRRAAWACAALLVAAAGVLGQELQVAPAADTVIAFSGPEGGPFHAQGASSWTLDSSTADAIEFSAVADQLWLTLAPGSGSTDPVGLATQIEVQPQLTTAAYGLAAGVYTSTVTFRNLNSGEGNTTRSVRLEIAPASLTASPAFITATAELNSAAGPVTVTLSNTGGVDLNFSLSWPSRSWLSVDSSGGTVPGDGDTSFNVLFNAFGLAPGTYTASITVRNTTNGAGDRELPVTFIVQPGGSGALIIDPSADLQVVGPEGEIPEQSIIYTLINDGNEAINWAAEADEPWVTISPAAGTVAAADGADGGFDEQIVQVRVNTGRQDLPAGSHIAVVTFNRILINPLSGNVNEIPMGTRLVRVVADPVLTVSVPLTGGRVQVAPPGRMVSGGDAREMVYHFGEIATLTAIVDTGYEFDGWVGDFEIEAPLANPLVVTMDASRSVSAVITPVTRTLTLTASGEGTGAVLASPAGSSVENPVVSHYANGTAVTLTASADAGWVFQGWDGNVPEGQEMANPLTVTMDRDRVITARFGDGLHLTIDVEGSGDVLVDPDLESYVPGTTVTLTAVPGLESQFVGWFGAATGTSTEIMLVLNASITVEARFSGEDDPGPGPGPGNTAKLTVDVQGDGVVTPPGGTFNIGAKVTLIATPGLGSQFLRWEGGATGSELTTVITMDQARTVMAVFEPAEDTPGRPNPGGPSPCGVTGTLGFPLLLLMGVAFVEPRTRRLIRRAAR